MKNLAIRVPVIESEAGWGSKIEDYMICLSLDSANIFIKEFNNKNIENTTPDWYMYADNDILPIEITQSQFEFINEQQNKRTWLSILKDK